MTVRYARLTTVVLTAVLSGVVAPQAEADEIGTVSQATAAAQLKLGLDASMTPSAAPAELADLKVADAGSMTGYDRDEFPHWNDASNNGWPVEPSNSCDSRNAALYRDGEDVTMSATCTNLKGTWVDPYSAKKFDATSDIDIDHVVPLANAWRSGADEWTKAERTAYANDPLVLVSSWDSANQSKSDQGPEEWKPESEGSWCLYATRWTFTKGKYGLSVTDEEKTALNSMLQTC
ncbi:HNH endonuclease family protein [Dermacoccaceae bacterium W4C1]